MDLWTRAEAGPRLLSGSAGASTARMCTTLAPSGRDDAGKRAAALLSQVCVTTTHNQKPKCLLPLSSRAKCRRSSLCDPSIETSFRFTLRKNGHGEQRSSELLEVADSDQKTPSHSLTQVILLLCVWCCHFYDLVYPLTPKKLSKIFNPDWPKIARGGLET